MPNVEGVEQSDIAIELLSTKLLVKSFRAYKNAIW